MKIIQFFILPVMCCFLLGISGAKAQPAPPPTCIQQCEAFCAAFTSNFTSNGTGPFSTATLQNLQKTASGSTMSSVASTVNSYITTMVTQMQRPGSNFYAPILNNCQSPSTYCTGACALPPPPRSVGQTPNVSAQK